MAPAGLDADDLDSIPLSKRRAMLPPKKLSPPPKKLSPSPPASSVVCALPAVRAVDKAVKREGVSLADLREWPGLPRGVKFDPSDEEFLWHLLAKVGKGEAVPHPLISEFIISLDEDDSFHYTHPQRLAGVKQDGSVSYFFQRRFKAFNSKNKKRQKIQISETEDVFWHTIGNTEAVFIDGVHRGCKKMMVLNVKNDEKPEETNWVMHQYHVGRGDDGEGDFVACKIFYDQYPKKCDTNTQSLGPKIDAENQNVDLISVEASNQGDNSIQCNNIGSKCIVDYSSKFTTCKIFKSQEAMVKWTRHTARVEGFGMTSFVGWSDKGPKITFGCERGGYYKNMRKNKDRTLKRGTKKCGCPFTLMGKKLEADDNWMLVVKCGTHNHLVVEKSILVDTSSSVIQPKDVLLTPLGQTDSLNTSRMKTIYSARKMNRIVKKARRSGNQQLVSVYRTRSVKPMAFVDAFPLRLRPYIQHVKDVAADGNCGFRVIASLMGFGEDAWAQVKNDLLIELNSHVDHYRQLYGEPKRIIELTRTLTYFKDCPRYDQWMTMPDMGHLIASRYNVVLFYFSLQQCLTFLPLRLVPNASDSLRDISIGFINGNHFVEDGSLRLPVDLVGNKKEYVNEKVLADQYPADIQLPFEEPTHSPSSTITGGSDAAAQSPSCSLGCQNLVPSELVNSLENEGTCHVKEEGNANCLCEMNTSFECTAGMLGSRNKGFEEASFTGTLLSYPDYVVSQVNKAQESNDQNCYQAHASELQPSNVRARVINLNDVTKLSGSTRTIVQMEVKTEHLDEGYAIAVKETAAELPQSDSIDMLDSVSSTVPVVAKTELLREKYTKNVPGPIGVKFYNTSVSGYPAENLFSATQCSIVLDNCAFSHPTSQSNHEYWNPNVAELSSSKVLDSGSINMSDNSCLLSQFSESAGDCQDKRLLIRSKLPGDTFGLESYPEGVRFDALSKLPNANCSVKVKLEPVEVKEELDKLRTEVKEEFLDRPSTDVLDHIPLKDRIEMAFSNSISKLDFGDGLESSQNNVGHTSSHGSPNLNPKTRGVSLRRRRKRTATDSVEAALEEDAPGLLQVLLDKGITVEEIKLYGDNEDGEPLEIYSDDDSFEELKTVMNKLFLEPSSLLKFSKSRHEKGPKAVYCLACLISLIEQTRYLRFRNSPVEWGWCRDLQSFIFVFEKHNRIVLERPEYGYATYFFELVDSVSADWQTKRLMTALKLTSCSRTTLIENRPLMVNLRTSSHLYFLWFSVSYIKYNSC